mmetsp:Transcript_7841/g.23594  ORF Transcript_7841/g.23594 Transcript_7841/m.23594 type:complete len:88 (-) Transcript_7841:751-1014(-)
MAVAGGDAAIYFAYEPAEMPDVQDATLRDTTERELLEMVQPIACRRASLRHATRYGGCTNVLLRVPAQVERVRAQRRHGMAGHQTTC